LVSFDSSVGRQIHRHALRDPRVFTENGIVLLLTATDTDVAGLEVQKARSTSKQLPTTVEVFCIPNHFWCLRLSIALCTFVIGVIFLVKRKAPLDGIEGVLIPGWFHRAFHQRRGRPEY